MVRYIKIFVAVLCIVCILALCIAPYADIPMTVLKALQVVIMLMFALIGGLLLLAGPFNQALIRLVMLSLNCKAPTRSLCLPLEINCVQQV